MSKTITITVVVLLILIRIYIGLYLPSHPLSWVGTYKALAHLFVGGLFVAWYLQRRQWQLTAFVIINVVEVLAAIKGAL